MSKYKIDKILFEEKEITKRINELAKQIESDYSSSDEIVCICVLRGGIMFFSDLIKRINKKIKFDFIRISSYEGTSSKGEAKIIQDTLLEIKNKDILIVEDIIDTGKTMNTLISLFKKRGAKSVKTAALLDKPSRRKVECHADYVGFEIDDVFVVGYGMDVDDNFRNLSFVAVIQ